eukprot:CAMPEP_0180196746 /NCGR_PEP_ID=MMETSP0987-20121128/4271_1 /TAXON_ID=697907 /ORGANISM="non described non described, Strain CCMP2293" /LENGTH=177 /DNA_ID=CAMNT_0022151647 /DNA_START=511 /DNA_END=1040 /DNA_ORIENTATION=-
MVLYGGDEPGGFPHVRDMRQLPAVQVENQHELLAPPPQQHVIEEVDEVPLVLAHTVLARVPQAHLDEHHGEARGRAAEHPQVAGRERSRAIALRHRGLHRSPHKVRLQKWFRFGEVALASTCEAQRDAQVHLQLLHQQFRAPVDPSIELRFSCARQGDISKGFVVHGVDADRRIRTS